MRMNPFSEEQSRGLAMFSLIDDTTRIYILCGYTDFRKGMDSLTQIAVEHGVEIQKNYLVLFMSKRKDRIKMLRWVKTGMDCSAIAITMILNAYITDIEPMSYLELLLTDAYKDNSGDLPWLTTTKDRIAAMMASKAERK